MSQLGPLAVFAICVGLAVAHGALHISHGATVALIVGAVLAFFEAVDG